MSSKEEKMRTQKHPEREPCKYTVRKQLPTSQGERQTFGETNLTGILISDSQIPELKQNK
jgi:hypothetical protein